MADVKSSLKDIVVANKRRSAGTLTEEEYLDAIKFFGGKCAYSGTGLSETNLHLDHIIPVTMGGTTDRWNSLPVCETCNLSKRDKHLLDWWDANRKAEDEYRLEKVLYYMLGCLVQNKKLKLSTGKGKTKTLDTWQFATHLLNHLMENKEYLKVTRQDIESGKVDILGDKEYESYITSRSVDQRLQTYGRVLSGLYKRESRKTIDLKEVYKTQNELVNLLKKLNIEKHYTIAFDMYDQVYAKYQTDTASAVENLKQHIVELSDCFKGYDKSVRISKLINRNPNLLVMSLEEVKGKIEALSTLLGSPELFINKAEYLNYSKGELKELIDYCNKPTSKITFEQLSISFFKYNLVVSEIKKIVDYVNKNCEAPVVVGSIPSTIYGERIQNFNNNLNKFIEEQQSLYAEFSKFWDSYLKAEKRGNKKESKVVIQSDEYYKTMFGKSWEEEKKKDIVRCLNGIIQSETFQGENVGNRLAEVKSSQNKSLLAFWNEHYGVDFLEYAERIKYEDKVVFWDAYLKAEKRENKDIPKVVVQSDEYYKTKFGKSWEEEKKRDIVRCLNGINQNGEIFQGENIGSQLTVLRSIGSKSLLNFWNEHYGIDFLETVESLKQEADNTSELDLINLWDAYLKAEKRENKDIPKVVVQSDEYYKTKFGKSWEEEKKRDIVRCLNGIIQGKNAETFQGENIGAQLTRLKQGKNKSLLAFLEEHYGLDFVKDVERIEYEANVTFWDAYLKAEKRENKDTPKVVVQSDEYYKAKFGLSWEEEKKSDIVRCLNGIIRGEIFQGENIGAQLYRLKRGGKQPLLRFWNKYYGIDFLAKVEVEENFQYEDKVVFWDSYLKAEKRENKDIPKVVIQSDEYYKIKFGPSWEEEKKKDIVRCLNGIIQSETFQGENVGNRLAEVKSSQNKSLLAFWNEHYGVDFLEYAERIKYEDKVVFWDSYLKAEKRENKDMPKVVVRSDEYYKAKFGKSWEEEKKRDIVRCLNGINQNGEIFQGEDIGVRLGTVKQGGNKSLPAFWNEYYGIDFLEMLETLKEEETFKEQSQMVELWDAYLRAEKRENKDIPKVVVQSDEYYKRKFGPSWEEEKKKDIVRCLNGIIQSETFQGENIGARLTRLKQGKNKSLLEFWNEHYGVECTKVMKTFEKKEKTEVNLIEFWDSYLKAEKRENKDIPKVVVKSDEWYKAKFGPSWKDEKKRDIVRCLDGIVHNGETFRGKNIGNQLRSVKKGDNKSLLTFWNEYYGVDFLDAAEALEQEENNTSELDLINLWDAYLRAEKRENKDIPKVVVQSDEYYKRKFGPSWEKEKKRDIVRCLNGIHQKGETFQGENIGLRLDSLKQGNNKSLLAFWNKHYGVDFVKDVEKIEYEANVTFWDAYLKAEKRENKDKPKVVVQSDEYYKRKFGPSWEEEKKSDIVRCLNGIIREETFQDENIGVRLNKLKQGNYKSLLAFWDRRYGVDFLEDMGKVQKEDFKKMELVCGKLGIKFSGAIKEQNIHEFEDKINYIAETFGREYITDETIGKSIEELQAKLSYLKSKGILYGVVTDPEILRLTTEQIEERIKVLKLLNGSIVVRDKKSNEEKLNFIFSMGPSVYEKMLQKNNIDPSSIDEQLARKFNQENTD